MNRVKIAIMGILMVVSIAVLAIAADDMGQDKFDLDGGGRGDMSFPHKLHQDTLATATPAMTFFQKNLAESKR